MRRTRSLLSLCACLLVAGMWQGAVAAEQFTARKLADNIQLITGPSGNTLAAVDTDGVILIDGVPAKLADAYLVFVSKLTGTDKIKAVVNSHWHDESVGLNAKLAAKGVTIIAHANTRQWLTTTIRKRGEEVLHKPTPKAQLPNKIFYDKFSLPFRGGNIELGYMLHAHTDGDIYAYFRDQNVLFTGPTVRTDSWSAVDESTNGYIGGFVDAYDQLALLVNDKTTVVPISGPVIGKAEFDEQHTLYTKLMKEMVALLRKSRSAEEVVAANPAIGLKPQWGDPSVFLDEGFRSFYGNLRDARHLGGAMP